MGDYKKMIRINPPIGQSDEMVLVPRKDMDAIMKAWREREGGKMNTAKLLYIFERWSSYLSKES